MPCTDAHTGGAHLNFAYGTPGYWGEVHAGRISWAQARRDHADQAEHRRRGLKGKGRRVPVPRHKRPAPAESKQFAQPIATTVARDRRLSPAAVRCAVLIRALVGKAPSRIITKAQLCKATDYHPSTIKRALADLRKHGYIRTTAVFGPTGLQTGQRFFLLAELLPFFVGSRAFSGGAGERHTKNQSEKKEAPGDKKEGAPADEGEIQGSEGMPAGPNRSAPS